MNPTQPDLIPGLPPITSNIRIADDKTKAMLSRLEGLKQAHQLIELFRPHQDAITTALRSIEAEIAKASDDLMKRAVKLSADAGVCLSTNLVAGIDPIGDSGEYEIVLEPVADNDNNQR